MFRAASKAVAQQQLRRTTVLEQSGPKSAGGAAVPLSEGV